MIDSELITVMPRWTQDLHRFLGLKSLFFLHGNIYDCYYYPLNFGKAQSKEELEFCLMDNLAGQFLRYFFLDEEFDLVFYYDVIDGFSVFSRDGRPDFKQTVEQLVDVKAKEPDKYLENDAVDLYRQIMANTNKLCACVYNFSSRITADPKRLAEKERLIYLTILKAAAETKPFKNKHFLRSCIVMVLDNLCDAPSWLLVNNPHARSIEIAKPNKEERKLYFQAQAQYYAPEDPDKEPPDQRQIENVFLDHTDGLSNRELENLRSISLKTSLPLSEIRQIVDLYKFGTKENFWLKLDKERIDKAESELKKRVKGQDNAIAKTVEVIRRARLGLDGLEQANMRTKPKGVLFFAGPTGVGKTELAKSVAELIFGMEDAIIRFDMSEYNDSNSDVKLIGAPPGYIGYEEGGQLTSRVREKPFSIILFDEIEKAHDKVFDKFLQILDDGRLTDSQGNTVYFSQTLIIFTSNLGIYKKGRLGKREPNVLYDPRFPDDPEKTDSYETMRDKIQKEIDFFFNSKLNRPEIRNRFGENFVIFDFIRQPYDQEIVKMKLNTITKNMMKLYSSEIHFSDVFIEDFRNKILIEKLIDGGRGINNRIESYIISSLTSFLNDRSELKNLKIKAEVVTDPNGTHRVVFACF
ncbi:MAG TPA: AAA family ATPase [Candidatus Cloacimonadota bacterium]|nr:AAA family ATPase [Candidatus Cloacimonadota bacterium]